MARNRKRNKQDKVTIRNKAAKDFCKALNIKFEKNLDKIAENACEKMKTTDNLYLLPVFLDAVNHVDLDKKPEEPWTGDPLIRQWAEELGMTDGNFDEDEDPDYNDAAATEDWNMHNKPAGDSSPAIEPALKGHGNRADNGATSDGASAPEVLLLSDAVGRPGIYPRQTSGQSATGR